MEMSKIEYPELLHGEESHELVEDFMREKLILLSY